MRVALPMIAIGLLAIASTMNARAAEDQPNAATAATAVSESAAAPTTDTDRPQARPDCVRSTGTRLRARDKDGCLKVFSPSRVYTQGDIRRTGETDIGAALERLDPSIRSHR